MVNVTEVISEQDDLHCILVGVEDSPSAGKAFRYAVRLAVRENAELVIAGVLEYDDLNVYQALNHSIMQKKRDELALYLHECRDIALRSDVSSVRLMSAEGDPAKRILQDILPASHADLLVIGQKSRNPIAAYFGTTASALVQRSPISVMVVK